MRETRFADGWSILPTVHMIFSDISAIYFELTRTTENSDSISADAAFIRTRAVPFFGTTEIRCITRQQVHQLIADVIKQGGKGEGARLHELLLRIFGMAFDLAWLDANPAEFPVPGILPDHSLPPFCGYTEEELLHIFAALRHNHLKNVYASVLSLGLTPYAIRELKLSDYCAEKATLHIPLRDTREISVVLSESQKFFLDREVERQKEMESLRGPDGEPAVWLFGNFRGKQQTSRFLFLNTKLVRQRSGVSTFSLGGLRKHFFVSSIHGGENPITVMQLLGLSSSSAADYQRRYGLFTYQPIRTEYANTAERILYETICSPSRHQLEASHLPAGSDRL